MPRLLLISNSTLYGGSYLEHCQDNIKKFLREIKKVLFIPYALHDRDAYAKKVTETFAPMGYQVTSIHQCPYPKMAVEEAESIFIGGGNTFRLLKTLYDEDLIGVIKRRVLEEGMPYIGSSAGSNVATCSINTTNDMPIVYPPSFAGLSLVPLNINPHYIDTDSSSKHMGETREERIQQYHEYDGTPTVLALREGCMLLVDNDKATLLGCTGARLFQRNTPPKELSPGEDLTYLLS